jgi:hypothetical protein
VDIFVADQEAFSLLRSFRAGFGAHSAFSSMRTGGESAKVLRTEPKFAYSHVCNAEFERSVVRDANIFQHVRSYFKIQGLRRVT